MLVDILVLQYFVWVFFLYFSFPFYDIDIVCVNSIIYLAFDHFIFRLAFVRFVIQFHKSSIWLGFFFFWFFFYWFLLFVEHIRILGIMFKFVSFSTFFLQLYVRWRCLLCIGAFKAKRRPSWFYNFFSIFCIETFLMCFILSPLITSSFFIWPSYQFLEK